MTLAFLAGCSTYEIKDAGDGVYYAESPPVYTYVDSYGWPFWYSNFYYTSYRPCRYSPYMTNYCHWGGRYGYHYPVIRDPYYAVMHKYPEGTIPKRKRGDEDVNIPVPPENPRDLWLADSRSLYYRKASLYGNSKTVSGKSGAKSSSSAVGKRRVSAPKQSYSRPTTTAKAPRVTSSPRASRSSSSARSAAPRRLD